MLGPQCCLDLSGLSGSRQDAPPFLAVLAVGAVLPSYLPAGPPPSRGYHGPNPAVHDFFRTTQPAYVLDVPRQGGGYLDCLLLEHRAEALATPGAQPGLAVPAGMLSSPGGHPHEEGVLPEKLSLTSVLTGLSLLGPVPCLCTH